MVSYFVEIIRHTYYTVAACYYYEGTTKEGSVFQLLVRSDLRMRADTCTSRDARLAFCEYWDLSGSAPLNNWQE